MEKLSPKAEKEVQYLEQDGLEVVHTGPMVLMKHKDGSYYIVDTAGTLWNASMHWSN